MTRSRNEAISKLFLRYFCLSFRSVARTLLLVGPRVYLCVILILYSRCFMLKYLIFLCEISFRAGFDTVK